MITTTNTDVFTLAEFFSLVTVLRLLNETFVREMFTLTQN